MAKKIYANDELAVSENDCSEELALCPIVKNIELNNLPHKIEKIDGVDIVKVKVFYLPENITKYQTICRSCSNYRKERQ